MKKRNRIMLTMGVVLALTLSGCSGGSNETEKDTSTKETEGKVLTTIYPYGTSSIDPATDYAQLLRSGVGECLYKITDELAVEPWLAETASANEDYTQWTIELKDGITFSDGKPCDAAAVKAWLDRMCAECTTIATTLNVKSIEADGLTLVFELNAPNVTLLNELAQPQTVILSYEAGNFDTKPVSTGPYKVDLFTPNVGLELSKNEYYWDGEVAFDIAYFYINTDASARQMALESGDADLIANPSYDSLVALEEAEGISVATAEFGTRANYIQYNCAESSAYTSDVNFRKAIDCLIDRNAIVESIYNNAAQLSVGCIPLDTDYTPEYEDHSYSVDQALTYFEAAGLDVSDGQVTDGGVPITLQFNCYESQTEYTVVAQLVQASLQSVGIKAEITMCASDINSWLGDSANDTEWDLSMASMFAMPKGEPSNIFACCYAKDSIYNYLGVEDTELFTLVDDIFVGADEVARTETMKEAALVVEEQCYMSFFVNPENVVAYSDDIAGVVASPNEYYFITNSLDVVE